MEPLQHWTPCGRRGPAGLAGPGEPREGPGRPWRFGDSDQPLPLHRPSKRCQRRFGIRHDGAPRDSARFAIRTTLPGRGVRGARVSSMASDAAPLRLRRRRPRGAGPDRPRGRLLPAVAAPAIPAGETAVTGNGCDGCNGCCRAGDPCGRATRRWRRHPPQHPPRQVCCLPAVWGRCPATRACPSAIRRAVAAQWRRVP